MADSKISALTELAEAPASTDEFVIVDKSDTTMAATGTTKRIKSQYVKPSEITAASSASSTKFDFFEDTDNGTNKITVQAPAAVASDAVLTLPEGTGTIISEASIHGSTEKTTPADADELGLIDSAASYVLKKLTWANLKATLKTYFDTLYTKATGAEITTGTDDVKFATSKALADAGVNTRLATKMITATRDYAGSAGDVAYTGVGFKPTAVIAIFGKAGATVGDGIGVADSSGAEYAINNRQNNNTQQLSASLIYSDIASGAYIAAVLKTFDSDGFTLTWSKTGSPTGTMTIIFLCFR